MRLRHTLLALSLIASLVCMLLGSPYVESAASGFAFRRGASVESRQARRNVANEAAKTLGESALVKGTWVVAAWALALALGANTVAAVFAIGAFRSSGRYFRSRSGAVGGSHRKEPVFAWCSWAVLVLVVFILPAAQVLNLLYFTGLHFPLTHGEIVPRYVLP